jgi:FkbM family methyltransferase
MDPFLAGLPFRSLSEMNLLSRLAARAHKLAQYIERPHLWRLRQRGVLVDAYLDLDRKWLRSLEFSTVLDIGANVGQFCQIANALWPKARIYSFEPLQDCFQELKTRMAGCNNLVAFNIGLGDQRGEITFQRNEFSPSSSVLRMTQLHELAYPQTRQCQSVNVKIERLDDKASELEILEPLFVKIDVQGYEKQVLLGGEGTVRRAAVLLIETSYEPLYEGQALFGDLHVLLSRWGFTYAGALSQAFSPLDGRILQADSIFVRRAES